MKHYVAMLQDLTKHNRANLLKLQLFVSTSNELRCVGDIENVSFQ